MAAGLCTLIVSSSGLATYAKVSNSRHSLSVLYSGLVDNFPVNNVSGGGVFLTDWEQMGGLVGPLGAPTTAWYPITGGQELDFQGGSIYWSSAGGTQEVHGPIYSEYSTTLNGTTGALGFPNSPVESLPTGGSVSYFLGQMCNGGDGFGDGSAIYYLNSTIGAHEVQGCIFREYVVYMGGPGGALGFPLKDEQSIDGGHVSYFAGQLCGAGGPNGSGSAILDTPATKAHEVQGCIYADYEQVGGPGYLGFPLTDEQGIAGGRVSYFAGQGCGSSTGPNGSSSAVYYASGTGAHEVQGCIYATYLSAGGPAGGLGFPVTDEFTYDGSGDRESKFQGGYITWNATTGQTSMTLYGCPSCQVPTSG